MDAYLIHIMFCRPIVPVEVSDEELVVEDDAELLLERIEEDMAAEEPDSEDDEDIFLHVDDLNKVIIRLRFCSKLVYLV